MEALINKKYITVNPYSRVGIRRASTLKIVVHYVANPSSTAEQNWNYFNGLAKSHVTSASSNFIIGLDGEIIQCMPIYEIAYANAPINDTSISIECCHPTNDGHFNQATYDSLVKLVSWLANRYGLSRNDVIRHFDVSGKMCPLYWAGDEGSIGYERWMAFKEDLIIDE
ncbi:MAG: N-acetylmuramoyl-L-alanine amidase [Clostridia bacterium]|nr:N-acetylmuramoyl-L-alanine amidase [Clostridia bacterium]